MDSLCRESFYRLLVIVCLLTPVIVFGGSGMSESTEIQDASDVTWAHAVNSRDELEKALASSVDFLEADISLGHVTGNEDTPLIPVMAHPPSKTSDIDFDTWLDTIATRGSEKGLKLDFKSIEVVEPSLKILQKYATKLNGFLWLSADILPGPGSPRTTPVQGDQFLSLCKRYFPKAALSLGWTTYWSRKIPLVYWQYDWKDVRLMADVVRCGVGSNYPPIAFSVRAIFASRSVRELQWLLDAVPHSTLTVWTADGDKADEDDFARIRKGFPKERVHYNAPGIFKPDGKSKSSASLEKKNVLDNKWLTITREREDVCDSYTYSRNDHVMFGKSSNILVLHRKLLLVDDVNNLTIAGRLRFFAGEGNINPTHWEHKLKVVLVDVTKIRKNVISYSKKKLAYTIRDIEALWSAVNSNILYNFDHPYFYLLSACRMFNLDLNKNLNFDAWTIPCDETVEDTPIKELSKNSILEASLEDRLGDTERIFMIGFYSYGEEFVLLHDLTLSGQDEAMEPIIELSNDQLALTSSINDFALTSSNNGLTHSYVSILLLILICIFM